MKIRDRILRPMRLLELCASGARDMTWHRGCQHRLNLRRLSGGVFEIKIDGQVAYSKKASGRFPSDEAIRNTVKS